jgi:cystathionine beta-lyase/cystathionine gamma-synthase
MDDSDHNNSQTDGASADVPSPPLAASAVRPATTVVQSGRSAADGALAPTIWPSTTFEIGSPETASRIARTPRVPKFYARHGNPSVRAFEDAIAELEGAEASLAFGSGMGALSAAILAFCPTGSHVIAQQQMYLQYLGVVAARLGIEYTLVDVTMPGSFTAALRPGKTTLVLTETPANPRLDLVDLNEVAALQGPIKLVDATFATPLGMHTLRPGIDISMHSATKAIAGHNDACLGVLSASSELIDWIWGYSVLLGATASPFDASNALRGLRTLHLRLQQQTCSALAVAHALEGQPGVRWVRHPGLASHPQATLAARDLHFTGGVLAIDLAGGKPCATRFMESTQLARIATSLGGPETLMTHPATTSHAGLDPEELAVAGISEGTLRISCGLEATEDLVADVERALQLANRS